MSKSIEQKIEDALMSWDSKIFIDGIEVCLNPPLKKDTTKNREKEARKRAIKLANLLK